MRYDTAQSTSNRCRGRPICRPALTQRPQSRKQPSGNRVVCLWDCGLSMGRARSATWPTVHRCLTVCGIVAIRGEGWQRPAPTTYAVRLFAGSRPIRRAGRHMGRPLHLPLWRTHLLLPPHPCLNCGKPLEGGWEYCPACGQKNEELKLPITHILEEVAEGIWHFDSKLWATIKAIFTRPGKITAEFLDGHRVRYVPPIRLYVFVSFVFFLLLSTLSHRLSEADSDYTAMAEAGVKGSKVSFNYNIKSRPDTSSKAEPAGLTQITKRAARLTAMGKEGMLLSAIDAALMAKLPDSVSEVALFDSLVRHLPQSFSSNLNSASVVEQNKQAQKLMNLGKNHRVGTPAISRQPGTGYPDFVCARRTIGFCQCPHPIAWIHTGSRCALPEIPY